MTEHRHEWSVGWDGYVCDECSAERSFSDASLTSVVLSTGTEERIVNALLAAIRADAD